MATKAGVWIDHRQAIVVLVTDIGKTIKKIASGVQRPVPSKNEGFFIIMTQAGHLSRGWSISTPSEDSPLEFGGVTQAGSGLPPEIDSIGFNVERADIEANNELVPHS